jgi:hypothetical protein
MEGAVESALSGVPGARLAIPAAIELNPGHVVDPVVLDP